jgi:hypothetical protein
MTDNDATFCKQVLNVALAEVETEVQPDGVGDDLGREAIGSKRRRIVRVADADIRRDLSPIAAQLDNSLA